MTEIVLSTSKNRRKIQCTAFEVSAIHHYLFGAEDEIGLTYKTSKDKSSSSEC